MKSLDERMWAVDGGLWCPYTDSDLAVDRCIAEFCAHYNPDTHECVHVEAAQAQKTIAAALALICSGRIRLDGTFRKIDEKAVNNDTSP